MEKADFKLDSLSLDQLLSLRDDVEERIQSIAADELDTLKSRIAQLEPYLLGASSGKPRQSKAKAKYRDPASGATWSGRGRAPVWLVEQEKAGKKRDQFEIG